ncbi:F149A protein, partial [Polyodon spathula]|nr:F149A protein [Polyodon spathula]
MLFEGKVSSRTQGLQTECKQWTKRSPHLRILGSQLVLPRDEGFQHIQKRTSSSKIIPSPSFLDSTSDMKELCLLGQKLVATLSPVHSAFGSSETSCSDPSLYSFLEEEVYEVDGKIEEYFAYDTKEICDHDEKYLRMGSSVPTSARNRLGRLQDHSILSSSRMMQTASCKPVAQRKLPVLSSEALRSKTRNVYRDEVLRGTKLDDEGLEFTKIPKKCNHGVPPVSPDACIKDTVTTEMFEDVWRDVVEIIRELIRKQWENELTADHEDIGVTGVSVGISCCGSSNFPEPLHRQQRQLLNHTFIEDEDTQMVNLENTDGKLLPVPASRATVDTFNILPSRGSELRSTSFWSNFIPSQTSRMPCAFHSSLKGVMTIQAKPLQQRHAGLTEKTHCDHDEKYLRMGSSVPTSARNRLGRLQDHSILSSSRMMQTASCKPVAQRKLPVLSLEALRSKTRNVYRDEVLRGTKLNTGADCVSSPSVHTTRKTQLPPINSETLEKNLSVPCNLLCRRRYPHSRGSSAIPESTGRQPLRERLIALEHFSRPNTTHTFRVAMLTSSFVCTKLRILVQGYVTSHAKNSIKTVRSKLHATLKPPRKRND